LGLFIFIGFATFVAMDKTLRIITGGDGHSHSHSHGHGAENEYAAPHIEAEAASTGASTTDATSLKNRKTSGKESKESTTTEITRKAPSTSIQVSSLLNLISDFTHNITDGLAMSGAFYAGPLVGASTCFAVMLHEIPHEVGDFALLIQGGFTKWQAMGAQFITALGAFTGTLIGIAIQEWSKGETAAGVEESVKMGAGIMGTDLKAGDLVLPFTAGTFLYVAFSAVPEVLETTGDRKSEAVKAVKMAVAMVAGFMAMFMISE
jgi:zinc transporter 7